MGAVLAAVPAVTDLSLGFNVDDSARMGLVLQAMQSNHGVFQQLRCDTRFDRMDSDCRLTHPLTHPFITRTHSSLTVGIDRDPADPAPFLSALGTRGVAPNLTSLKLHWPDAGGMLNPPVLAPGAWPRLKSLSLLQLSASPPTPTPATRSPRSSSRAGRGCRR